MQFAKNVARSTRNASSDKLANFYSGTSSLLPGGYFECKKLSSRRRGPFQAGKHQNGDFYQVEEHLNLCLNIFHTYYVLSEVLLQQFIGRTWDSVSLLVGRDWNSSCSSDSSARNGRGTLISCSSKRPLICGWHFWAPSQGVWRRYVHASSLTESPPYHSIWPLHQNPWRVRPLNKGSVTSIHVPPEWYQTCITTYTCVFTPRLMSPSPYFTALWYLKTRRRCALLILYYHRYYNWFSKILGHSPWSNYILEGDPKEWNIKEKNMMKLIEKNEGMILVRVV